MSIQRVVRFVSALGLAAVCGSTAHAGGEAGPISLRDQGFFWVGVRTKDVPASPNAGPFAGGGPQVSVYGQMHVGFQLVAERKHPYPLILVHGGGGQATDYMGTPDGRDGWLDYFLAAGFDVYFVDRPAHGRSPNNTAYGNGALAPPPASGFMGVLAKATQWPGDATDPTDPSVLQHVASSEPGPTVDSVLLKENFAELLDKVGPAIVITHSAGGPSGWLAADARPDKVKALVAIEAAGGFTNLPLTWQPALPAGEALATEKIAATEPGKAACDLQPAASLRTLPAFANIPVMGILAPESRMFTPNYHCTIDFLNQAGGQATLFKLEEHGITGNGHFMNEDRNNGDIARLMIEWIEAVEK